MAESFLRLPASDRSEILRYKARELGRRPLVLEKDIWVCWSLHQLFSMQDMPRMAFKGGTSLSKVFDAIHRFSEDVDVTFDYRDVRGDLGFDDDPETMSGERLKKFRKALEGETFSSPSWPTRSGPFVIRRRNTTAVSAAAFA